MRIIRGLITYLYIQYLARPYIGKGFPQNRYVPKERRHECLINITKALTSFLNEKGYFQKGKRYFIREGKERFDFVEFNFVKRLNAIGCSFGNINNEDLKKVPKTKIALSFYASYGNFEILAPPGWKYDFCWNIKEKEHDQKIIAEIQSFLEYKLT